MSKRHTMTPIEFDAACRELQNNCPTLSETSGTRSEVRNVAVGGHPESKHRYGIGKDFTADDGVYDRASAVAADLGLWFTVHDKGSGNHLHVQGAAPGPLPDWWLEKYYIESEP